MHYNRPVVVFLFVFPSFLCCSLIQVISYVNKFFSHCQRPVTLVAEDGRFLVRFRWPLRNASFCSWSRLQ